jgi:hypothetical protein
MAYIGKQPTVGNFVVLDAITTSATTTFALKLSGVAYYPATANNCIVSLNGIIQAPISSFTISGSNIVFSSALTSTDVIDFIQVLGDVLNIGTPSDNTVSLAKLTATGTKDSTTFLRGDNTFAVPAGGANTPAFQAYTTAYQSVTENTATKLSFATEDFDTNSNYDNSTNYRFTPTTSGKYFVYAKAISDPSNYKNERDSNLFIYKNGSNISSIYSNIMTGDNASAEGATNSTHNITAVVDMNGSSDYLEVYGQLNTWNDSGATFGYKLFGAYKLIT